MFPMADNEPVPTPTTSTSNPPTNQISTADLNATPVADSAHANRLYSEQGPTSQGPAPTGTTPEPVQETKESINKKGTGVEGEEVVWEARYSMKNFIGRLTFRALLTVGWIALAAYTWGYEGKNIEFFTILAGIVLVFLWLGLIYRIIQALYGHYYRLTTKRLFVSTGLFNRRRDQVELIKVNDVFTRQRMIERWLSLGTVVVVSSEQALPTCYLLGVNDPKHVMDLVWHYARTERDRRSVMVDRV